jgi:hypothetical protein
MSDTDPEVQAITRLIEQSRLKEAEEATMEMAARANASPIGQALRELERMQAMLEAALETGDVETVNEVAEWIIEIGGPRLGEMLSTPEALEQIAGPDGEGMDPAKRQEAADRLARLRASEEDQ